MHRNVFNVDAKSHAGHMKAVQQSVTDGTLKWSAKIVIVGERHGGGLLSEYHCCQYQMSLCMTCCGQHQSPCVVS